MGFHTRNGLLGLALRQSFQSQRVFVGRSNLCCGALIDSSRSMQTRRHKTEVLSECPLSLLHHPYRPEQPHIRSRGCPPRFLAALLAGPHAPHDSYWTCFPPPRSSSSSGCFLDPMLQTRLHVAVRSDKPLKAQSPGTMTRGSVLRAWTSSTLGMTSARVPVTRGSLSLATNRASGRIDILSIPEGSSSSSGPSTCHVQ